MPCVPIPGRHPDATDRPTFPTRFSTLEDGTDDYIAKPVQPRASCSLASRHCSAPAANQGPPRRTNNMVFGQFKISQATRTASLSATTF